MLIASSRLVPNSSGSICCLVIGFGATGDNSHPNNPPIRAFVNALNGLVPGKLRPYVAPTTDVPRLIPVCS